MHRDFINLVSETVDEAHANGVDLFYESLENSLNKDVYIGENTLEETLTQIFNESASEETNNENDIQDLDD